MISIELQRVGSYEDDQMMYLGKQHEPGMSHQVDQLGVSSVCVHCQYNGKLTDSSG